MAVWSEVPVSVIHNNYGRLDAEFFRPEYLQIDNILQRLPIRKLKTITNKIDVGHVGPMVKHYCEDGVLFIQTQQIGEFFLDLSACVRIDHSFHELLTKSQVNNGNILIARSGSFGKASIYMENEVINSADIIIIDINKDQQDIDNLYLLAFLNSKYGSAQLIRYASGGLQGHVNLTILEDFKVPVIPTPIQEDIRQKVRIAYEKTAQSKALYNNAKQLLESELGLDKLVFEKPIGYEASFSEVVGNNRADADYYQVPFRQIEKHLSDLTVKPLAKIASFTKGIEVGSKYYTSSGKLFIRVSNVKENGIETGNSDKYISNELFNQLPSFQPQIGELLLTKDGTPGICYVVDEIIEGVISSGIVKMKMVDQDLSPEYLALVINSKICRMQIERACSGALIVHWKPVEIGRLKIPILSSKLRQEISDLAQKSKNARRESARLLIQVKKQVEDLIEEATNHEPVS